MELKQKFELRYFENSSETGQRVITVAFDGDKTVTQLLEEVMSFMKAVGYCFNLEDRFEVVNDFHDADEVWENEDIPTFLIEDEV